MPTITPLTKEKAAPELAETFDGLTKRLGKMPNFFALLAYKPEVLKSFLALYPAITGPGALEQRYKELAYLKTSITNGCEY